MIRGNKENYLLKFANGSAPVWWHTSHEWAFTRWCYQHTNIETMEFIRSLPKQRAINISDTTAIRILHGSARSSSELIYPDQDISPLNRALEMTSESVLVFGHTHAQWQILCNGRLAINPGAVCGSLIKKACANYAILAWENSQWVSELRNVKYDTTPLRAAFLETGLLEQGGAFARAQLFDFENGVDTTPALVAHAYQMAAKAGYPDCEFVPDEIWDQATKTFNFKESL